MGAPPDVLEETLKKMTGTIDLKGCSFMALDRTCCDFRVYEGVDAQHLKRKCFKIAVAGMQELDVDTDVDIGLVDNLGVCMLLDPARLTRRVEPEGTDWTAVMDFKKHEPQMQDDGRYAFPLSFMADKDTIKVEQSDGMLSITLSEKARKRK